VAEERGIALVTGANRGIGREVVRQLAQAGFTAILGARDSDKGEAACAAVACEWSFAGSMWPMPRASKRWARAWRVISAGSTCW
jgi:NAD(P)-dependent dehydrogenase (short-subunit alcohol dehydrogenase family)